MKEKEDLKKIFMAGVDRVLGFNAVHKFLENNIIKGDFNVVSLGKAGSSMAQAVLENKNINIKSGLIITKRKHLDSQLNMYKNIECLESDHPTPSEQSIICGEKLIKFIEDSDADSNFLFLLSGGGSSLAENLIDGFSLNDLVEITDALLSRGYNINEINAVRKYFSKIKGGKLANYIHKRKTIVLTISDVPHDDPKVIASGPLSYDDFEIDFNKYDDDIIEKLKKVEPLSCPNKDNFLNIQTNIIAKLDDAKLACSDFGKKLNYNVHLNEKFIEGDVNDLSNYFHNYLLNCPNGLHIWGGESSVQLPISPGRGGRNQQLSLLMAEKIQNVDNVIFLSAGTDGTDGPTNDAGGIVDGKTINLGEKLNLNYQKYLTNADSGSYLNKVEALITTGPTGTNVMDLILAIKS